MNFEFWILTCKLQFKLVFQVGTGWRQVRKSVKEKVFDPRHFPWSMNEWMGEWSINDRQKFWTINPPKYLKQIVDLKKENATKEEEEG